MANYQIARPSIKSCFDNEEPDVPDVKYLTARISRQILACRNAKYAWSEIDAYLKKTPGTTARWNREKRYDALIKEEEQKERSARINARRDIRSGIHRRGPMELAEEAKYLSDDDFQNMTSLMLRNSSLSRREMLHEQTMAYLPKLRLENQTRQEEL